MDTAIPQWLSDIWYVYGDIITPVLQMVTTILVTAIGVWARKKNISIDANTQAILTLMNSILEKKETEASTKAVENGEKIDTLQGMLGCLLNMFSLAFTNSNLDPEIKTKINDIADTIKYGTSDEIIACLKKQIQELTQKLLELQERVENEEETSVPEPIENPAQPEEPTPVRV